MTIIEQPSGIVSAYDEQILEVIDTAATSTGYVTAKVEYHNGDGHWVELPRQAQKKYRNTNKFRFNISPMLQQAVYGTDNASYSESKILLSYNSSSALCRVKLEHFELSSGVYTSQSTTTSSTFVVVNSILDPTGYPFVDGSQREFLTTQKTQLMRNGEHLQFAFLWNEAQLNTQIKITKYPLSGSSSTTTRAILPIDYEAAGFYGIDGDTLTSSPTLTTSNAELAYVTASDDKRYIGVRMDNAGHITFNNSDVGLKVRIHIFALATGSGVKITYNGAGSNETLTITSTGFLTLTGSAIPSGTTSIKIENLSGQELLLAYANILDEGYTTVVNNRGIAYIDEYDSTLDYIEVYVENDSSAVSETLTIKMKHELAGLRLAWKDSTGNIEHYTFTDYTDVSNAATKRKVESEDVLRGIKSIDTKANDVYTVYTFHENDQTLEWLSEIVSSPEVWLVNSYDDKIPVDVITGDFPKKSALLEQGSISFRKSNYTTVHGG